MPGESKSVDKGEAKSESKSSVSDDRNTSRGESKDEGGRKNKSRAKTAESQETKRNTSRENTAGESKMRGTEGAQEPTQLPKGGQARPRKKTDQGPYAGLRRNLALLDEATELRQFDLGDAGVVPGDLDEAHPLPDDESGLPRLLRSDWGTAPTRPLER